MPHLLEYHLYPIPAVLRPALESCLERHGNFLLAWLQALNPSFPGRSLVDLLRNEPGAFPPCWIERASDGLLLEHLVMENSVVRVRDAEAMPRSIESREAARSVQLEAFENCRFQKGYASEGMLCNEPPLPLRVLDFLEAADHINLSLVCKGTHQAVHLLFKREEAAAERALDCDLSCNQDRPSPHSRPPGRASWARLLREIRFTSLLLGTPEGLLKCESQEQAMLAVLGHVPDPSIRT